MAISIFDNPDAADGVLPLPASDFLKEEREGSMSKKNVPKRLIKSKSDDLVLEVKIEDELLLAGAIPGQDYTYLDLFKLAQTRDTNDALEMVSYSIDSLAYGLRDIRDLIEKGPASILPPSNH